MSFGRRRGPQPVMEARFPLRTTAGRSTEKERKSELKERELGLDCAGGWNMTLDFWAAVKVGSGIMAFPCNFDQRAPSSIKTRQSQAVRLVCRFVFSKLMSRGGDPFPPVPELAKGSGRESAKAEVASGFVSTGSTNLGWGKSLRLSKRACPSPACWRITGRCLYTEAITQRRRLVKRRQCLLLPRVGGATAYVHCLVVRTTPPMTHAVPTICTNVTRSPRKTAAETMTRIGMRFMKTAARCGVTRVRAW